MAKPPPHWMSFAAALVALLLCRGALAGEAERFAEAAKWERLAATPGDGRADEIKVSTARAADGRTIQVDAVLSIPVNPDLAWAVLNDFENMPEFVPGILATRLIGSGPDRKRVEIDGMARIMFFSFPIHTTVDVVYPPGGSIAIDSVAGNLAVHAIVQVRGVASRSRVDYKARVTPTFWMPPLIGDFLIGRHIRRQFEGMVGEMHRRAASHRTQGADGPSVGGLQPDWGR